MRWTQAAAENLMRLRAVAENDDWDAYHDFRKHQCHARPYDIPFPNQHALEMLALTPANSVTIPAQDHCALPLVA